MFIINMFLLPVKGKMEDNENILIPRVSLSPARKKRDPGNKVARIIGWKRFIYQFFPAFLQKWSQEDKSAICHHKGLWTSHLHGCCSVTVNKRLRQVQTDSLHVKLNQKYWWWAWLWAWVLTLGKVSFRYLTDLS